MRVSDLRLGAIVAVGVFVVSGQVGGKDSERDEKWLIGGVYILFSFFFVAAGPARYGAQQRRVKC